MADQFVGKQVGFEGEIAAAPQIAGGDSGPGLFYVVPDLAQHLLLIGLELAFRDPLQVRIGGCQ